MTLKANITVAQRAPAEARVAARKAARLPQEGHVRPSRACPRQPPGPSPSAPAGHPGSPSTPPRCWHHGIMAAHLPTCREETKDDAKMTLKAD